MKKSSFVEGTFLSTFAIFLVKILGMLYVIPFYAMVGIKGAALYAYAYNIYVIFLDISTVGLPIAISKIISEYETLEQYEAKERAYKIGLKIVTIVTLICFTLLFVFAPNIGQLLLGDLQGGNTIEDVALVIRVVSLSLLIVPFLSVTKGYLQGHKIISVPSTSQVIEQVIRIGIILIGAFLSVYVWNLELPFTISIALSGAFIGALVAYIYIYIKIRKDKTLKPKSTKKDAITNKEITKKIFSYSIPFIIINTVFSIYNFVDMVFIMRTLEFLKFKASDIEFITSSITTWSGKISMIVATIAMGMTVSLIPIIVEAFTKKDFKEVNFKLNQALQIIVFISLPMTIGISMLSTPIWNIFYGLENNMGPTILSIAIFVTLFGNLFMISSSTLQSLNKFKLVYKATILGLLLNMLLDIPSILLFNQFGLAHIGASVASIIGYSSSFLYILYKLNKEHDLNYKNTLNLLKDILIPIILMIAVVLISKELIPVNYDSKISTIIYAGIVSLLGGSTYILYTIKTKVLQRTIGEKNYNKIMKKLHLKK